MKAVANASPIIFLGKLDALSLLPVCFGEIAIPEAVADELGGVPMTPDIRVIPVSHLGAQFVAGAVWRLHRGDWHVRVGADVAKGHRSDRQPA